MQKNTIKESPKFKIPHIYVIIFVIMIVVSVLTYFIPAGAFDYTFNEELKRNLVDPDSFHYIDSTPTSLLTFLLAIPAGLEANVNIVMLVVLIIASFEIVNRTGALNAGIYGLITKLRGRDVIVISCLTFLFSTIAAFLGWGEAMLIFVPVTVSMVRVMGYDSMLGIGIVMLGAGAGFTAGPMNIYTTGVAQGIAGLPIFSGIAFRIVAFLIFTAMSIMFLLVYARKVKAGAIGLLNDTEVCVEESNADSIPEYTARRKIVTLIVVMTFIIVAVGTSKYGWYLKEISGTFILMGIVVGFVAGTKPSEMAQQFAEGAKSIIPAALIIGMARGILYLMQEAHILDTICYALANALEGVPGVVSAIIINLFTVGFNFFITSGSSKAAMLMPLLMPLGDLIGMNRQVITIAYQFGDGFTNYFWPTSGIVMAALAMGGNISWVKWAKWTWKLVAAWTVAGLILTAAAQMLPLGPF